MRQTSARLLKLLALLQTHRDWTGSELSERLGVTTRTVRRDVDRLRELGYPVHATQGSAGYQLGAGASLPPLLLDDDEAVAVAIGLRTATASSVSGIEETALRALRKLEQVLPSRLRHRVQTLQSAVVRVGAPAPAVSPDALMAIADACRRHEGLRFDYTSHQGSRTRREVQPQSLVSWGRQWYLVGWDTAKDDWRTFRVDRLTLKTPNGPRFDPRDPPGGDVVAYLGRQLSEQAWPYRATVLLHESAEAVADRVWPGMGAVEAVDGRSCRMHLGAESPWALVWMLTSVDADFTVLSGPPELRAGLRAFGTRCLNALG